MAANPSSSSAKPPVKQPKPNPKQAIVPGATKPIFVGHSNRLRTWAAALCGVVAVLLVLASILTVWFTRTVSDTDTYTKTVAPLVSDPNIQKFLAVKTTETLVRGIPPEQVAAIVLTPDQMAGQSPDQLKEKSAEKINATIIKIIEDPQIKQLWRSNNYSLHEEFVKQMKGESDTFTFDFSPLVRGLVDQVGESEFSALAQGVQIPEGTGKLTITSDQSYKPPAGEEAKSVAVVPIDMFSSVRKYYETLKTATIVIVVVTVLMIAACVALSIQHMRTLRRILIVTGALTLGLALILQAPSLIILTSNSVELLAVASIMQTLFHDLKMFLVIFGIGCILGALASKITSFAKARRA